MLEQRNVETFVDHAEEAEPRPRDRSQRRMRVRLDASLREVLLVDRAGKTMHRRMQCLLRLVQTGSAGEHHVSNLEQLAL